MQKKKVLLCLAAVAYTLQFAACSGKADSNLADTTNYYSVSIDGDYTYYKEDDEEIINLSEMAVDYLDAVINRDYKTADMTAENEFYTKELRALYESSQRAESQKASIEAYELVTVLNQATVNNIVLYTLHGVPTATVVTDFISTIEHATTEYLDALQVKANVKYVRTITYIAKKEENGWKVESMSVTPRVEVK